MENYLERLPDVIDSVATNQFYLIYYHGCLHLLHSIMRLFTPLKRSSTSISFKVERRNSDSINRIYQRGAYLMDPFYQEIQKAGLLKY